MPTPVTDFVYDVKRWFPDVIDSDIVIDLNTVAAAIYRKYRVITDLRTINFTAGVQQYALDPDIAEVYQATWYDGPGSYFPLAVSTVETLDNTQQGWRSLNTGTPTQYYIDGALADGAAAQIGFTPATQYSTGDFGTIYPYVLLDVSLLQVLSLTSGTGLTTIMPVVVTEYDAWLYGILKRLASQRNDQRVGYFTDMEKKALLTLDMLLAKGEGARSQGIKVLQRMGPAKV